MTNYEFQLTPAFCLYNGAAVLEQRGAYLKVLIDNENEDIYIYCIEGISQ